MRFKFKGTEETHVQLPGESQEVITVVPGEVVELEHVLADEEGKVVGLARHLWEETRSKVGRPEQPEASSPVTGEGVAPGMEEVATVVPPSGTDTPQPGGLT